MSPSGRRRRLWTPFIVWVLLTSFALAAGAADPASEQLGAEIAARGWILYSARTTAGDFDLFLARPDGTQATNLTRTPNFNEFGGRFSPDSRQMLYRRTPKNVEINHDLWGAMGVLVIANADGSSPKEQGPDGELPWASWGKDTNRVACLYKKQGRIRIVDLATKQVVQDLPRQGIFQQLFWSPDGSRLCGTANLNGQDWNVVSLAFDGGAPILVSRALNCTADWFHADPQRIIYSNRTPGVGSDYGWTMLMQATADGQSRTLIYGERGRHVYFGCTSPDDRYAIFSTPESDGGADGQMAVVRLADTPIIVPADYQQLKALYPEAKNGPVFRLPLAGFEPYWTYAEVKGRP
jgi:Tol biopolymer transport system component